MKFVVGDKLQSVPLFEIQLNFVGRNLTFKPTLFDLREAVKTSIAEGVNTICRYDLF